MYHAPNPNGTSLARVLAVIHQRHEVSRAQLTQELALSRTAVGQLQDELQALGLVRVGSPARPPRQPGRPTPVDGIDPAGPIVLAAQVHQSHVVLASVGLGARIATLETADVDPSNSAAVCEHLARWIDEMRTRRSSRNGRAAPTVLGVGVAVPGLVRSDGFVHSAPYLGWDSVALQSLLNTQAGQALRIEVGNDANFAALGEYRQGAGAGARTLLCLLAEELGVGGGLVLDGELFTGSAGYGFEAGHLQVNPRGRLCACGARGCLQVQCDSQALLRAARRPLTEPNPAAAAGLVLDAARRGDQRCQTAVEQIADWLAIGLTGLVNLLNPDRIALLGVHRELARQQHTRILAQIDAGALVAQTTEIALVPGALEDPVLVGAAERAFEPLLRNPRLARASASHQ